MSFHLMTRQRLLSTHLSASMRHAAAAAVGSSALWWAPFSIAAIISSFVQFWSQSEGELVLLSASLFQGT